MNTNNRLAYLDIAKCIGIIMVVAGHVYKLPDVVCNVIFSVHMPLFFIISGFCFSIREEERFSAFLKRNARSLLLPYAITSALVIIVNVIKCLIKGYDAAAAFLYWLISAIYGSGSREGILETLNLDAGAIGVIWFLLALFVGRITFYFVVRSKSPWLWALIALFVGCASAVWVWLPFSIQPGICSVFFLYIGYAIKSASLFDKGKIHWALRAVMAVVWLYSIIRCGGMYLVECYFPDGFFNIIGAVCGTFTIVFISQLIEKYAGFLKRPMASAGRMSLGIMCAHLIVLDCWPRARLLYWTYKQLGRGYVWIADLVNVFLATALISALLFFIPKLNLCFFPDKIKRKL